MNEVRLLLKCLIEELQELPEDERVELLLEARSAFHAIEPLAVTVSRLYFTGWSNKKIAEVLGIPKDEVLRLKQVTGLGTLFENRDFSPAWDVEDDEDPLP